MLGVPSLSYKAINAPVKPSNFYDQCQQKGNTNAGLKNWKGNEIVPLPLGSKGQKRSQDFIF
jgi:hypothetical protein